MPDDVIDKFLKRTTIKRKPDPIDEFLSRPSVARPAPPPVPVPTIQPEQPGFLENLGTNLKVGLQRAGLNLQDAERMALEAIGSAFHGDFGPSRQILERTARGAAPFVSAMAGRPEAAAATFISEQAVQAPRIAEIARQQEERLAAKPEFRSREAAAERARLDVLAALDPSLVGKITRRGTEAVVSALPEVAVGTVTGGSVPAMAGVAAFQSLAQPEMMIPAIALSATPIPLGRVVAPIVRRIKIGRAPTRIPGVRAAIEQPVIPTETPLPGVEAPSPIPVPAPIAQATRDPLLDQARRELLSIGIDPASDVAGLAIIQRRLKVGYAKAERLRNQLRAEAGGVTAPAANPLQSAVQKLGTDSVDEIAEMIANANRRFNKTITTPGVAKRAITPTERQSAIEDFNRIRTLTKEENDALAEVLPERTVSPIFAEPGPSGVEQVRAGQAREIRDIPLSEPSAQLDANLRQLKAFFGSQDIVRESRLAAAIGNDAADPTMIRTADLGLETVPVPVRSADMIPVSRRVSVDDITLGRDTLSKGRMFGVQESLKGGVKAETKGVPLRQQVEPMTVVPDPNRPGKFIVEDDGNHRIALLKLQGVRDDIPVKSFETPTQTASIRATVGPRAGEIAPMEVEITDQLRQAIGGMRARRAAPPSPEPSIVRNLEPLEVESMAGARQLPLMDVAQKNRLRKALNLMADVLQIPKSIMSSGEISGVFRQGGILTLPPSRWGRAYKAAVEMFRALVPDRPTSIKGGIKAQFRPQTERYQRMVDVIASDSDAVTGMNHGLKLMSQAGGGIRKAEEEFISRSADRIPIVRETQQAYTMYLDNIRLNTFKLYKQAIDKRAAREGFSADQIKRGYEAAARWINIASGRGNFGEKADRALDALNFFIWSPRFTLSRFQVLNPLTYLRNARTPEGRTVLKMQMSEMAQVTSMIGATLLLAKAAGFKVGTNPEKPNFLQISLGNYHYDGLMGLQPEMRLIYDLGADAMRAAKGEPPVERKGAIEVATRFIRSKTAPIPSFAWDFFARKTFEGKPFNLTTAAVERISPMMWFDMVEAYQREDLGGLLNLLPSAVGFGVKYREPDPIDAAIEQRPQLLNELTRLQVRIRDPRRKPGESDDLYKGRQEAIARLYSRYATGLMSSWEYANQSEAFKQKAFNILHSRILDAVNTRDPHVNQFEPEAVINAVRKAEIRGELRQERIAGRPPL